MEKNLLNIYSEPGNVPHGISHLILSKNLKSGIDYNYLIFSTCNDPFGTVRAFNIH